MLVVPTFAEAGPAATRYRLRRIFERHRPSLVQVRSVSRPTAWRTGFLVGSQGELVFGARERPERELRWRGADGREHPARLLSYDPGLRLAVARGPILAGSMPLMPAKKPYLRPQDRVVTIRYGAKGKQVPHAGVVARRQKKWGWTVRMRGQLGAPVFDAKGGLVGVVRTGSRRTAVVMPIRRLMPFFKKAVLGGGRN